MSVERAIESFRDAIAAAGLHVPDEIISDGQLHRFATNGRAGDDAGWYVLHEDGVPAGAFGDWRTGIDETWRADIGRQLNADEQRAHRERVRARQEQKARDHDAAAERAQRLWDTSRPATTQPYLEQKNVAAYGIKVDASGALIVPMRAADGTLCSLQFISANGDKRFLPGGRVAGCYHAIGVPDGMIYIAEGYATAASVRAATGHAVAVAFNAGNLAAVAKEIRAKLPDVEIIIAGDNDENGAGQSKATDAAAAVGAYVAIPAVVGKDWNDLHCELGAENMKTALEAAKGSACTPDALPDLPPLASYADEAQLEREAIQGEPSLARPPKGSSAAPADPLAWLEDYTLNDQEAEQISDPTWVEPGLIVEGHIAAIVAKPNGGKTTIMFWLACKWAGERDVVYVDSDTNPSDAKRKLLLAKKHGVVYLTPDLKKGKTMRDVVAQLERLAMSDAELGGHVWLFDTLKKMANVINKDSLKHTMGLMRKLSSRGMTCILLAHTNKYRNAEGQYQYEGTGDLEADCDELIYFEPRENEDKSLTVSTRCSKRRADIGEFTWDIHDDRSVTRRDHYLDVAAEEQHQAQLEKDETAIEAITDVLRDGPKKQHELVTQCIGPGLTLKSLRGVLKRYRGKHWLESRLPENNALEYRLIPRYGTPAAKPAKPENLDPL